MSKEIREQINRVKNWKQFLNESVNVFNYEIEYNHPENVIVRAIYNGAVIGLLTIIDDSDFIEQIDDELIAPEFNIVSVGVDEKYRNQGVYINLIKHFLKNNKYGVKELFSYQNPDFNGVIPRSTDGDNFWKHVYKNQKKYGVKIINYDGNYEISLK